MARNHYTDAFGVCDVEWHKGEPNRSPFLVLVEVWRANLLDVDPQWSNPLRSQVHIAATIEPRLCVDGVWMVVGYEGTLRKPEDGEVRRWASFKPRSWTKTITLDGWSE